MIQIDGLGAESGRTFEVLSGVDVVRVRLKTLAAECRRSVWAFQPMGAISDAEVAAARALDRESLSRGIEMRSLYLDSVRNRPITLDHATWLTEHGAEVRTVPVLPMRMLLIDHEAAVFPIDPEDSSQGAIVTSNRSIVRSLEALFHTKWQGATSFGRRWPLRTGPFSQVELQVIRLWSQGHTNVTIARRLGVATRTVYRIGDRVRRELGAGSAFQAGSRAIELGLIADEE